MDTTFVLKKQHLDLTGLRFGRLIAIQPLGLDRHNRVIWLCRCDCGNTAQVASDKRNKQVSCGCYNRERSAKQLTVHGNYNEPLYHTWWAIIARCTNPKNKSYHNYGGRGIKIDAAWQESFDAFCTYVSQLPDSGKPGYSLDRINNDGHYEPGNVRWATQTTQCRNTRHNRMITYEGQTHSLVEWAEILNMKQSLLISRLHNGWSIERAFAERPNERKAPQRRVRGVSGYKGVHHESKTGKWIAIIHINGRDKWLGRFDDKIEAAKVHDKAALEAFGDLAYINFLD